MVNIYNYPKKIGTPTSKKLVGNCIDQPDAMFPDEDTLKVEKKRTGNKSLNIEDLERMAVTMYCNGVIAGRECPIKDKCREYAITNNEPSGVWGGLIQRELRQIKRNRAKSRKMANAS